MEYSDPALNRLALIIQRMTHDKWKKFIDQKIFIPAGMQSSKITDGPYSQRSAAHGYELKYDRFAESDYEAVPIVATAGNGGVWSTTNDLAKYEQALQQHTFLSKYSIRDSRTVHRPENWNDRSDAKIGYGFYCPKAQIKIQN